MWEQFPPAYVGAPVWRQILLCAEERAEGKARVKDPANPGVQINAARPIGTPTPDHETENSAQRGAQHY